MDSLISNYSGPSKKFFVSAEIDTLLRLFFLKLSANLMLIPIHLTNILSFVFHGG